MDAAKPPRLCPDGGRIMDGREKNDRGESPYHVLGERPGAVVAPPGDLRAPRGVPRGGHGARGRDRSERSA